MLQQRPLGPSGLHVSTVGLGGNTFGPPRLDEVGTIEVVHAALDAGVNFVDTAIVYGGGKSETYLGRALRGRRDEMVVATKCHFFGLGDERPEARMRNHAEESLRKLGTDRIDLLQVHFPSDDVAADDLLLGLDELVRSGKVLAVGVCNYAAWRLAEARCAADRSGTTALVSVQNHHNLLARDSEPEVLPYCRRHGLGFLPYHPLAGGFLTGKYRAGEPPPPGSRGAAGSPIVGAMSTEENWRLLGELERFCTDRGRTLGELAIAWLLADPTITSVIAGASNADQVRANAAAADWSLGPEDLDAIASILSPLRRPGPERPPYA